MNFGIRSTPRFSVDDTPAKGSDRRPVDDLASDRQPAHYLTYIENNGVSTLISFQRRGGGVLQSNSVRGDFRYAVAQQIDGGTAIQ
jgi:N-acyl-D-aspartate/D-glutamate deacylase